MRQKRSKIVDQAIHGIDGFAKVFKVIHQNTVLRGQSKSTFENYLRRIAIISLHFGRMPEDISDDEIREYLTTLALRGRDEITCLKDTKLFCSRTRQKTQA